PLRDVFAKPSLRALAEATREALGTTLGRIEIADRRKPLPLSLAQQRLWFIDQLDPSASAAYHIPATLRLLGKLDVAAFQATLDRVVARHEGLRTRFLSMEGVPCQQFAPADCGFALARHDLRGLDGESRERLVREIAVDEARAPFDLTRGPLIRGQLLAVAEDEHVLLITQHHIVSDGWSLGILMREVAALYAAFRRGEDDPLPPLEIQYADYAQWQRSWLQGEELARQVEFWKRHLTGAPALLDLPLDRPRPAMQSHAGDTVPLALTPELTDRLRAFSQRHGVTLFMTLLSAWGVLLSRLSGQTDVVIGTPVANRQRREVENLIGFFVNTLALRLRFDEQPTAREILEQVKETTLAAFAHQELPFEQVVETVQPHRSLAHSPLFQVMLALNNTAEGDEAVDLPDLRLAPVANAGDTALFDLSLSLSEQGGRLFGSLRYATALFERSTVERWSGYYVRVLEAMLDDPSVRVDALPLLPVAEREQVLRTFNSAAAAIPHDACIHELFEQQAAARPDAPAVIYENDSLTYAEVDQRANRVARMLIDYGVQPDDRVALCLERSVDMVVALLGILKAGGAYVPLDPAQPDERLAWMLQDCEPAALVTQSSMNGRLSFAGPTLTVDDENTRRLMAAGSTNVPAPRMRGLNPSHLAYVIYTSGSTGKPKGVMIEHRSVVNLWKILERLEFVDAGRAARVGLNAPISFDGSLKSLL
ncbi:MAG TPA: condensation domain-containing protein, partial [Thermoanaerobaculia bacterium]|nr:condensation domain-containing protein [Thermoanaerobaculia bacterium]